MQYQNLFRFSFLASIALAMLILSHQNSFAQAVNFSSAPPALTAKQHRPALTPAFISKEATEKSGAQTLSEDQPLSGTLYDCGHPTNEEQYLLELINYARANPDSEGIQLSTTTDADVSDAYTYWGAPTRSEVDSAFVTYPAQPPLAFNGDLIASAHVHDNAMIEYDSEYHVGPDGSPDSRMTAAGYNVNLGWSGENVDAYGLSMYDVHASFLIDFGNLPTVGHRENIMNFESDGPEYYEIGIGVVHGGSGYPNVGPIVVTEDFGQRNQNFILGVVYSDFNGNGLYDIGEGDSGVTITVTGGSFYAVSSGSGGYAIPYSGNGSVTVTASGGPFTTPVQKTIDFEGSNMKVDFSPNLSGYPTQVSLVTPVADTTIHIDTFKFVWDTMTVATDYHIQIATDSLMTHLVLNDSTIKNASFVFGALNDAITYYWRVQAKNAKGSGPWSATASFSVALVPSPVVLVFPGNGSSVPDSAVNFIWQAANREGSTYWLIVTTDKARQDTIFQDNTNQNTYESLDVTNFLVGQTYYWNVAAQNENGWGNSSAIWSFTVGSASVAQTPSGVSTNIVVLPNPSNGSAHIQFTLAASENVSLLIFNSAGEQVQSLDLGMLPAGQNDYLWNESKLDAGAYECQIQSGSQTQNAKMVIIK